MAGKVSGIYFQQGACKSAFVIIRAIPAEGLNQQGEMAKRSYTAAGVNITSAGSTGGIHGSVMYEGGYRSFMDTPFAKQDFYQHYVVVNLEVPVKDKFPFRISFSNRFSNNYAFRNLFDVNLQFDPQAYKQKLLAQVKERLLVRYNYNDSIAAMKAKAEALFHELHLAQQLDNGDAMMQEIIAAKERELYSLRKKQAVRVDAPKKFDRLDLEEKLANFPGKGFNIKKYTIEEVKEIEYNKTQLDSIYKARYNQLLQMQKARKEKIDSLQNKYSEAQAKLGVLNLKQAEFKEGFKKNIEREVNAGKLAGKLNKYGVDETGLSKADKILLGVRSFNLGRALVNYSELTAKNISITGVQAEYNPGWYFAIASGFIDYRFRENLLNSPSPVKQYLTIARIGKGFKEHNHFYVSWFTGRRVLYNYPQSLQRDEQGGSRFNLAGFAVEKQVMINRHTSITGEFAKSTLPFYSVKTGSGNKVQQVFSFEERSNEAYSFKLNSFLPTTGTRITGYYKHFGNNFQSFSVFTNSSEQTAWELKINQLFFKRRIGITAGLRTNEFSNPVEGVNYKSGVVFKSLQATARFKKLPVISVGYYPVSQLISTGNGQAMESMFYTLTGSANYFYKWKDRAMNTAIVYTNFRNESSDSSFLYNNSTNLMLMHSIFSGSFTYQTNASYADLMKGKLFVLEEQVQWRLNPGVSVGAGCKYNKSSLDDNTRLGYSIQTQYNIKKLGQIQMLFDKSFLPTYNNSLKENYSARLGYLKTF